MASDRICTAAGSRGLARGCCSCSCCCCCGGGGGSCLWGGGLVDGGKTDDAGAGGSSATIPVAAGTVGSVPAWLQAARMLGARQQHVCMGRPVGHRRGRVRALRQSWTQRSCTHTED